MSAEIDKKIDECISALMEHCDSVRIFVTAHNGGKRSTRGKTAGAGNYFAQKGQIEEWVEMQREIEREEARREVKMGNTDE